jgi:hypothetical protein
MDPRDWVLYHGWTLYKEGKEGEKDISLWLVYRENKAKELLVE